MIPYCILTIPAVAYNHLIQTVVAIHRTIWTLLLTMKLQKRVAVNYLTQILNVILLGRVSKPWPLVAFHPGSSNDSAMHVLTVWPQ